MHTRKKILYLWLYIVSKLIKSHIQYKIINQYYLNYTVVKEKSSDIFCGINEQKLFWEIGNKMQAQIEALIEIITMNIGYPIFSSNLEVLFEYSFYFDICAIIFPQLNIKIIKIGQDERLNATQKIQKLLELLTQELQINLAALSGKQILRGNFLHVYQLLSILKQFSELPIEKQLAPYDKFRKRVYSCPNIVKQQGQSIKQSQSVQEEISSISISRMSRAEKQIQQEKVDIIEQSRQELKNGEDDLGKVEKGLDDKNKIIEKGKQRKKQVKKTKPLKKRQTKVKRKTEPAPKILQHQPHGNKKYFKYKQKFMRRNQGSNKKPQTKKGKRDKSARMKNWNRQVESIDDFFKSFELTIRDQKQKYLRKMLKIIQGQEIKRVRLQQKAGIQKMKHNEEIQTNAIRTLVHSHQQKKQVLKQRQQSNKQIISLLKKQQRERIRRSEREIKVRKEKQIKQIKNHITQLNNKILMKFEDGGELQQMVLNMYRKY